MFYMVLVVIDDLNNCPKVLDAWDAAKTPGITILESRGMASIRMEGIRDDMPMMPSLSDIFRSREHRHRTIFTVVEGEETVDQLIDITQEILGDLKEPDTGVLFVLPVSRAVGLQRVEKDSGGEQKSP